MSPAIFTHDVVFLHFPTQSALLTGRYAWRTGSDFQIPPGSTIHVNLNMTLFPEFLQNEFGYRTLMLGKWHLGHISEAAAPFNRGFDECLWFNGLLILFHLH